MKKIIVDKSKRPIWRHRIFPWGWISLDERSYTGEYVYADGYYKPSDGGGGLFYWNKTKPNITGDGHFTPDDNNGGLYVWDDTSVEPENLDEESGPVVIASSHQAIGRWVKQP